MWSVLLRINSGSEGARGPNLSQLKIKDNIHTHNKDLMLHIISDDNLTRK